MINIEILKELYKETYADSVIENHEVSSINSSIMDVLLQTISVDELDELTLEVREEHGLMEKTEEQLKIEEQQNKIDELEKKFQDLINKMGG